MPFIRRALAGPPEVRSSRRFPSLAGTSTATGVDVSPERSLQIGAVYSCVRLLSEAVASLPVSMFRRRSGTRIPVEAHPVLSLVKDQPNPDIDAGELWRSVMGWMLLRGNGYVYVQRNGAGKPIALWPIAPTSIEVKRTKAGRLAYTVTLDDAEYAPLEQGETVIAANMMHFRAFGLGAQGLSPVGLARQSVGISFAAQQYMGKFFANDASPGGVVQVEGQLTDAQYERLQAQWKSLHEGYDNAHRLALLEGGATWEKTTLAPGDAQFIETQKFTRGEIASLYGVPPHMIGDTEKSTSWGSGIAEQGIGFVTYSLRPWLTRLERVARGKLLDQPDLRLRWSPDGLMQGDMKARYDAYSVGKQWGWLSTNDIRRREDEAPVEGGDTYLQPLNMVPAGTQPITRAGRGREPQQRAVQPVDDRAGAWLLRHQELLKDVFAEQRDEALAALRSGDAPMDREHWDAELAARLHSPAVGLSSDIASEVAAELGGSYDADRAAAFLTASAERHAKNLNITTEDQINGAIDAADEADEDPGDHVGRMFEAAIGTRAAASATSIVRSIGNFARHEGAAQAGARTKTWRTTAANPRPSHAALDGETVGIDETFSNGAKWPSDPAAGVDEVAGCTCEIDVSVEE